MSYEPLDPVRIQQVLGSFSHYLDRLEILESIDSTNTYLVNRRTYAGNYAVLAEQQTMGRGKLGNIWVSPPGNLYCSLLGHHTGTVQSLAELYRQAGHAVLDSLQEAECQGATLKLPNDIFYTGKKLGGILIELFPATSHTYDIILGVGINLHPSEQHTVIDQPWTTIESIHPQLAAQRNYLAGLILKHWLKMIHLLS